jgi:hypothetical protein
MKPKWNVNGGKVVSMLMYHAMKRYEVVEVYIREFLASAFAAGGQLHDLAPFTKGGKVPILLDKRLVCQKVASSVVAMRIMPGSAGNLTRSSNS